MSTPIRGRVVDRPPLVRQPSAAPTRKLVAVGGTAVGAALVAVILYVGQAAGWNLDPAFVNALVVVLLAVAPTVAGYVTRNRGTGRHEVGRGPDVPPAA